MRHLPTIDLIMNVAADEATGAEYPTIEPEHLFIAILKFSEFDARDGAQELQSDDVGRLLLKELSIVDGMLKEASIDSTALRRSLRKKMGNGGVPYQGGTIHRSAETKRVFELAFRMSAEADLPGLGVPSLLIALLQEPTPRMAELLSPPPVPHVAEREGLGVGNLANDKGPQEGVEIQMSLGELSATLKRLRDELRTKVFGQDHAIHAFVEGLFNAEVVAAADESRRRPKGLFVFAGPPGVGKTYLAECASETLGRPFKRFDMSSFSSSQNGASLIGMHKGYVGSQPGLLTEFVSTNPNALLLFDEVEKAHLNIIQLFLQVLDAGRLEDKFTEKTALFRDAIIIFTTNAGKALYEDSNATGVYSANRSFHKKTILDALENELDPRTGNPIFPQAICSRMATGYPLMFNRLGVNELEKVARAELDRVADLLQKQYLKKVEYGPVVALCMVLREGAMADARTVRAQSESWIKTEMFNLAKLFRPERLQEVMEKTEKIVFDLDSTDDLPEDVKQIMEAGEPPRILLVSDDNLTELWSTNMSGIEWKIGNDGPDVLQLLEREEIDLVLLDILMGGQPAVPIMTASAPKTMYQFDHIPAAARGIAEGQEILRGIHEKHPEIPCFLLSLTDTLADRVSMDDELLLACIRSGGARGVIETQFCSQNSPEWEAAQHSLSEKIEEIAGKIHREKRAFLLGAERKVLSFDTVPAVDEKDRSVRIRIRNLRIQRALSAADVNEVLQDVEKPSIRFSDVYGADAAKAELDFIVKWVHNPRQYKAMGLRPPRGVLLYGNPGTGKTMLARALAGECGAAFINTSATNFVTIWQGSGPQNVRDLFSRARKYAPSIIFIDEIDAIGRKRGQEIGTGMAEERTLNALLTEMDGFSTPSARPVIVLAATNLVEKLDEALLRRFDREVEVDKPDRTARAAYLRRRLQGTALRCVSDSVIERLSGQTANMTIAQLERIVELAGRMASGGDGIIADEIVEEAFERMRLGDLKSVTIPNSLLRTARHEAGHCLIGWLQGRKPHQISIVARGGAGGFVETEIDEDKMVYSLEELEGLIRQSMGGRAAEIVYYGDKAGLTTGASADLKAATHYAELMVRDYGMAEGIGQVVIDPRRLADGPLAIKVMEAVETIIKRQLDAAIETIRTHQAVLDRLVEALMDTNRLTVRELEEILPRID